MPDMDWTPVYNEFMRLAEKNYTNEEWFCNLDTEDKAREISDMTAQGYWKKELVYKWLKEKHNDL